MYWNSILIVLSVDIQFLAFYNDLDLTVFGEAITHKSTHTPQVYHYQTPIKRQVYHTVSNRCPTKTNYQYHQRPEINTISMSTAPGSQLRGNTPSPALGTALLLPLAALLPARMRRCHQGEVLSLKLFISHSQLTSTSQRQHIDHNISIHVLSSLKLAPPPQKKKKKKKKRSLNI